MNSEISHTKEEQHPNTTKGVLKDDTIRVESILKYLRHNLIQNETYVALNYKETY